MIKRIISGLSATLLSLSSLVVFTPMIAHAAVDTCTWDGSTNSNWNTAANWSCGTDGEAVPGAGDSLVFPYGTGVTNKTLTNDVTAGTSFASITFSGTGSSETVYNLSGNAIQLSSGITNTSSGISSSPTVDLSITAASNLSMLLTAGINLGANDSTKTLALGSNSLTVSGSDFLMLNTALTGSGGITLNSQTSFYGNGSGYTGTITHDGVSLYLYPESDLANASVVVNAGSDVTIYICDGETYTSNFDLDGASSEPSGEYERAKIALSYYACDAEEGGQGGGGGGPSYDESYYGNEFSKSGAITLAGNLAISADTKVGVYTKTATIKSTIAGAHTLTALQGASGTLVLDSASNGSTTANGSYLSPRKSKIIAAGDDSSASVLISGNIEVAVNGRRGEISVENGGLLKGTGTVGVVTVDAESYVGPGNSPGCLNTGNLTEGGTYNVEVGGATACTGHDQLKVTGTVNVTGGTVDVSFVNGFKGKAGEKYTIIDNDGSDAVTGTFKDLAEGATFKTSTGYVLKVSYKGGSGNDVVLSVVSIPGSPNTGFGLILNNPAATLAGATLAAGALYIMSRRLKPATKKVRR